MLVGGIACAVGIVLGWLGGGVIVLLAVLVGGLGTIAVWGGDHQRVKLWLLQHQVL